MIIIGSQMTDLRKTRYTLHVSTSQRPVLSNIILTSQSYETFSFAEGISVT
jgi:hypothetical protein